MSLFVINRYEGEDKEEIENETNNLSELLKKIEERKRQRATANNESTLDVDQNDLNKHKKKKKKSLNTDETNDLHIEIKNGLNEKISEQTTEMVKTSTKKKRKRKDDESEHAVAQENEELEEKNKNLANEKDDTENLANTENVTEKEIPLQNNFVVLGTKSRKKQREVKRVLPDWLAHPEIISADLNSGPSLEELDSILDAKLIEVLKTNSIVKLFPVQSNVIKWLHKCNMDRKLERWPRDTCVSAPTGSGKTLAYVLPIIQELQTRLVPKIRCLIVLPVQELAAQVHKVMLTYTSHTNLKVGLLSGAFLFEQEQSSIIKKTERGKYFSTVDIIIATPGRLVDHILKTPGFSLDSLKFLVIDEADRAAEWMQYLPEPHSRAPILTLGNVHSSKITPAQKLLFSATLSQDPEKLSWLGLFQPILFTTVVTDKDTDVNLDKIAGDFVGRYTSPGELTELAVECNVEYKPVALYQLLTRHGTISKTLVFTNSGHTTHRLALLMQSLLSERNVAVGELSAQLAPKQRESVLGKFASAEIHILISSDALARGLDIPDIQLVVSYDVPKHIKGYIHRAGRTGRAGKPGIAITLLTPNQVGIFKQMLSGAHKVVPNIERMELNDMAKHNYLDHLKKLKDILEKEKNESLEQMKAIKRRRVMNVTKQNKNIE
ncbi:Putative atp-dependent rna helicase dbp73d-like protein [Camponotus japonicus]